MKRINLKETLKDNFKWIEFMRKNRGCTYTMQVNKSGYFVAISDKKNGRWRWFSGTSKKSLKEAIDNCKEKFCWANLHEGLLKRKLKPTT